jgi:peptidoglycan/xylan/chitin deacetylase (PgdA/CDA1 family)
MIRITLLVLNLFFILYICLPWAIKIIVRKRFLDATKRSGCVCLTFDDGPNPIATPRILEMLKEAGAKATFFVIGENVKKYPELVIQSAMAGHEIGEHGYKHTYPWLTGPFRSATEMMRTKKVINKYRLPGAPILYRPPYGKFNLITLLWAVCERRGFAFWDIDPKDYKQISGVDVAMFVTERLSSGSVVLLHDGRVDSVSQAEVTVGALRIILDEVTKRRLHLTTVGQALIKATRVPDK